MRGQRLFIRPIEKEDTEAIDAFLRTNGEDRGVPPCGLLAKLVGDLVAALGFEITGEGMRIERLVVARELRRKHIGRMMIDEASQIAVKVDRDRLIVDEPGDAREFFHRVGFVDDGGRVVRRIDRV